MALADLSWKDSTVWTPITHVSSKPACIKPYGGGSEVIGSVWKAQLKLGDSEAIPVRTANISALPRISYQLAFKVTVKELRVSSSAEGQGATQYITEVSRIASGVCFNLT